MHEITDLVHEMLSVCTPYWTKNTTAIYITLTARVEKKQEDMLGEEKYLAV